MFYPLSSDYIKFLNDPDCHGMNYDQWKDKKKRLEMKKYNQKKSHFNGYPKYNY